MKKKTEQVVQLMPTGETYTVELYEFHELPQETRDKIVDAYIEERAQWVDDDFRNYQEREIWDCVHELEMSIHGARVSWKYNPWYSCDFDVDGSYNDIYGPDEVETVEPNGYYASCDLCDAWNSHVRKLNALNSLIDYLCFVDSEVYPVWTNTYDDIPENRRFNARADEMRLALIDEWYKELDKACEHVAGTITGLLAAEWDYVTSREAAEDDYVSNVAGYECYTCEYPYYSNGGYTGRTYYHDSRQWFTVDGELYEQSDINHECVSIVRASR